jgi:hypothetical protein
LVTTLAVLLGATSLAALPGCKKGDGAGGAEGGAGASSSGATGSGKALLTEANCKADTNKSVEKSGRIARCNLSKELTVDGFTCGVDVVVDTHPDGSFKGCYLKEPKVVDGYSCKDALDLYPGGKLHRCKVTAPKNAGPGIDVRAGDWVTLSKGGTISRLELGSGPNKIHDLTCRGYLNYFYEDGKTKKCELAEDAVIEGKKVSAKADGGSVYVCFDAAGKRLADCKLLTGVVFD